MARLTGIGVTSCSHQDPPSGNGDRWCVFTVPRTAGRNDELWVINVSLAARDEVPACDGTNSNCLRLTTNLWTEFPLVGPVHPYSHQFWGDTLIFYADATSRPGEVHRGPVFGWRPGWLQARRIATGNAVDCAGHKDVALVHLPGGHVGRCDGARDG